jgi:hypothetical protein
MMSVFGLERRKAMSALMSAIRGTSGLALLNLSSSHFDPKRTFRPSIIVCQSWPRWVQESLIAQVLKKPATRDASFLMTRSLYCDRQFLPASGIVSKVRLHSLKVVYVDYTGRKREGNLY